MKKSLLLAVPALALGFSALALPGAASAADGSSYQATLASLNHSSANGNITITLNGDQATVSEQVSGLASTFSGKPYPHVQHVHIGGGSCPTASADKSGDGVVSVTEGAPSYGGIGTTLATSGDTSAAAGVTLTVAPSGGSIHYSRTFTMNAKTVAAVKSGKGVVVVHGLDPATLSKKAQGEKSDLVPSLPLAATSPAACGVLAASQMSAVPSGSADTGGGSTAGFQNEGLLALGGSMLVAGAAAGVVSRRRRTASER